MRRLIAALVVAVVLFAGGTLLIRAIAGVSDSVLSSVIIPTSTAPLRAPPATGGIYQSSDVTFGSPEQIVRADVTYEIRPNGDLGVVEELVYRFPGPRHGIYRKILERVRYDRTQDRVYPIEDIAVSADPGTPTKVETSTETVSGSTYRVVRIGDPDRTIDGTHSYRISYTVRGSLNRVGGRVELYWNAVPEASEVPTAAVAVTVHSPDPVIDATCYAGPVGSTLGCESATVDGSTATFAQTNLGPAQPLTVVVAIPETAVTSTGPVLEKRWSLGRAFSTAPSPLAAAIAALVLLLGGLTALVLRRGRDVAFAAPMDAYESTLGEGDDPPSGTTKTSLAGAREGPVEYGPPQDQRPGQLGTLIDEVAHPVDVTATVVDLAVRQYLHIAELPRDGRFGRADWTLTRLTTADPQVLKEYEHTLLDALFETGPQVQLSDLKTKFATPMAEVRSLLYDDAVGEGWFAGRPDTVRAKWAAAGIGVFVVGAGLTVLLAFFTAYALVGLAVAVAGIATGICAKLMPARTPKGSAMLARTLGFRRFLSAGADRQQYAERQNLFLEYLPYAVAFGVTEKWEKVFRDLGIDPVSNGIYWYSSPYGFDSAAFGAAVGEFTTVATGTLVATPPSSSGGSGFSGGFSGGGGGGGSTGSW